MAPALPIIKPRQCIRALERAGFYIDHQTGSHARLLHRTRPELRVTVPAHTKDLPRGTLRNILRQGPISRRVHGASVRPVQDRTPPAVTDEPPMA